MSLTTERKDELRFLLQHALEKYIDKNSVLRDIAYDVACSNEEEAYLKEFDVDLDVYHVS